MPDNLDPAWAWAAYRPDDERPWDLRRAGHLYRRAAFSTSWDQLQQALRDGPTRTIDRLLRPEGNIAEFNRTFDLHESKAIDPDTESIEALGSWWLRRMIQTPHPLLEKMTLFWHNHFAATNAEVKSGWLIYRHVQMIRRHALGQFPQLLAAIVRDPAMLASLAGRANRKAAPARTFVQALVEQYTLGPGKASADDIREAARAMTGWFVVGNQLRYLPHEHDGGIKTILGEKGPWKDEDLARILLKQPAAAPFLIKKLYRWLISETAEPEDALLAPLAESFAKHYDIAQLVETMLRSNLFFSVQAYRQRIKSPVEFALGIIGGLEALVPTVRLGTDLSALGQHLGQPPTVKGWPGGTAWINRATIIGRSNLATALLAGGNLYGNKLDPLAIAARHGRSTPEAAGRFLFDLFLQADLPDTVADSLLIIATAGEGDLQQRLRRLAHAIVTLPEYHLS